jgi:hypothetical protein
MSGRQHIGDRSQNPTFNPKHTCPQEGQMQVKKHICLLTLPIRPVVRLMRCQSYPMQCAEPLPPGPPIPVLPVTASVQCRGFAFHSQPAVSLALLLICLLAIQPSPSAAPRMVTVANDDDNPVRPFCAAGIIGRILRSGRITKDSISEDQRFAKGGTKIVW